MSRSFMMVALSLSLKVGVGRPERRGFPWHVPFLKASGKEELMVRQLHRNLNSKRIQLHFWEFPYSLSPTGRNYWPKPVYFCILVMPLWEVKSARFWLWIPALAMHWWLWQPPSAKPSSGPSTSVTSPHMPSEYIHKKMMSFLDIPPP